MALEIATGIGTERKARRMAFRESVEGEGSNRLDNPLLRLGTNGVLRHTRAQFNFDVAHALL
jgi:hypothetical protein